MKGIALDLGTSGFRAQAIDADGKVLCTVISGRHPLPGANVMDHLHFAIDAGQDTAHRLVVAAVNVIIDCLGIDLEEVTRVAVCGNPIQLSLFEGGEIRDLAFAGKNALKKLGIEPLQRGAKVVKASDIGLNLPKNADVLIPPVVKHEIGADALAMMYMTKILERDEVALVTDYGTNAEMALKVGDQIYTGSAAAGPALEGQHITAGMLAAPGAIADIQNVEGFWECYILDHDLNSVPGDRLSPLTGQLRRRGFENNRARGITGTGVVAVLALGIRNGLIGPPAITNKLGTVFLQDGIVIKEKDVKEAGKAIGAIRAGHLTLVEAAGISIHDVEVMYMTGASGTYVDARKAQQVGLLPGSIKRVVQAGNTSLAMAGELVRDPDLLEKLQVMADSIRTNHIMFADSKVFKSAYTVELAYWDEGMPFSMFNDMLKMYKIQPLPELEKDLQVVRLTKCDILDIGRSLEVIYNLGITLSKQLDGCTGCRVCEDECPESALKIAQDIGAWKVMINSELCSGTACRRCESECPVDCLKLDKTQYVL